MRLKEFENEEYQLHSYDWYFLEAVKYAKDLGIYDFDFLVDLRIEIREQFNHCSTCNGIVHLIAKYTKVKRIKR